MKFKKTVSILLLLVIVISMVALPTAVGAETTASPQEFLDMQMDKYCINGVAYVTKNGKVICQNAYGMANVEEGKEMTVDTLFPIGSNSKQFCATAILILRDQGKLSVDDTLSQYFPEYTIAANATIKDLLTMRSGVRNHLEGLNKGEYTLSVDSTEEENQQVILDWLYSERLIFKPNGGFRYSNANYFLLSLIVEKVSGQDYDDFIKENILEPLGMNNTGFYEELMNHPDLAEHTAPDFGLPIEPELKGLTQGCGDLVSNAEDMDKWMTSLREHKILSEESFAEMTTNYTSNGNYGYGVCTDGSGIVYHTGGIVSYLSMAVTFPEDKFNVFVVSNDYETGLSGVIEELSFELSMMFKDLKICGDVNIDMEVNVKDATMIQKATAELVELSETETLCADVNDDTDVNIKDATAIQKYIALVETNLPIGEYI